MKRGPANDEQEAAVALSIRQPWAALLVAGAKQIEIRSWRTSRRGLVFIHASAIIDSRLAGWRRLPSHLLPLAQFRGGIIGKASLIDCRAYRSKSAFRRDQARHGNPTAWFRQPCLWGLVFEEAVEIPFQSLAGKLRFFKAPACEE